MRATPSKGNHDVLAGGGELGERMRDYDWSQSALGPVEAWPQSLRTCVRIILTSSQPMFVWWGDQLINLYNDAYCSILGGKHPWALGRPASEVWHEIWDSVGPRAARAMHDNQGTFDEGLLLIMERNGYREETYYTFSYSPVPGDAGEPGGILCANSVDTPRIFGERQQALLSEVAARTTGSRTPGEACTSAAAALATNARDLPFALVYTVDAEGDATLAAMAGIAATHRLVTTDALPTSIVVRTATLQRAAVHGTDVPQGAWSEPPTEVIGLPIYGSERAIVGVLVVGRSPVRLLDDDYRRFLELVATQIGSSLATAHAYEAERLRAETLAELDRAKTTFFSNISHEFRTPLTLMLGPTEDALRSPERALAGEALEGVHRNEVRLLKLVNALLDFSRIEAGRVTARFEATDLAQLTRELASAFRSAMERAGLAFDVQCEPLGAPIWVDRNLWEKIVLNLLSNALKFTFEGGVTVRLRGVAGGAELTVEDTGTGIPAAQLPRLFERFHRVEGARSRTHEGSGIGLALAHELVKLHAGTLTATSEVGRGTKFTVTVPMGAVHAGEPEAQIDAGASFGGTFAGFLEEAARWLPDGPAPASEPVIDGTVHVGRRSHILAADDNADMRAYLRRLLSDRWDVTVVADGRLALAAARGRRPNLIITDVMMPNLDGFGLLHAVRQDPALASVPVVMLSARAGEESRIEGLEAGADDYLVKPFSARELTARVHSMLQLEQLRRDVEVERDRLVAFVHQTPVGVAVWEGPDHRPRLFNAAYERLVARTIVAGSTFAEVLPELVGSPSHEKLQRCYREGVHFDTTETLLRVTGTDGVPRDVYVNSTFRPLYDDAGEISGVITMSVDVSEAVRTRHAVEESRASAVAANRAKDEFLAMLGHELRNPLAPIQTAIELMRLRGGDAFAKERAVIERQTQHLSALVDDLLDVSRITRGMLELRRDRVRLVEVIDKAVEIAAPLFESQRHQLDLDVPTTIILDGDVARLTQVFSNLLTNAAKYTDPGGHVTVTARVQAGVARIAVRDTGRGIAADILPHIFDRFVQEAQNIDRSRGGLGLGLAIVKSLVELHGGSTSVESAGPGHGSTFTVTLPATVVVVGEPTGRVRRVSGSLSAQYGTTVLIVDDNVDAATGLADVLMAIGCTVRVAHDAARALVIAETYTPDVALLDLGLPAMDGFELARRLREIPGWDAVRLLAVTGYGQVSDRARSEAAGFDHHLVKPISLAVLRPLLPTPGEGPTGQPTRQ